MSKIYHRHPLCLSGLEDIEHPHRKHYTNYQEARWGCSPFPNRVKERLKKAEAVWTNKGWQTAKNLDLNGLKMTLLPLMDEVRRLDCAHNCLTSLHGCPRKITHFIGDHNKLETLEEAPTIVLGLFSCENNKPLTSMHGGPGYIEGSFFCHHTALPKREKVEYLDYLYKQRKRFGKNPPDSIGSYVSPQKVSKKHCCHAERTPMAKGIKAGDIVELRFGEKLGIVSPIPTKTTFWVEVFIEPHNNNGNIIPWWHYTYLTKVGEVSQKDFDFLMNTSIEDLKGKIAPIIARNMGNNMEPLEPKKPKEVQKGSKEPKQFEALQNSAGSRGFPIGGLGPIKPKKEQKEPKEVPVARALKELGYTSSDFSARELEQRTFASTHYVLELKRRPGGPIISQEEHDQLVSYIENNIAVENGPLIVPVEVKK